MIILLSIYMFETSRSILQLFEIRCLRKPLVKTISPFFSDFSDVFFSFFSFWKKRNKVFQGLNFKFFYFSFQVFYTRLVAVSQTNSATLIHPCPSKKGTHTHEIWHNCFFFVFQYFWKNTTAIECSQRKVSITVEFFEKYCKTKKL